MVVAGRGKRTGASQPAATQQHERQRRSLGSRRSQRKLMRTALASQIGGTQQAQREAVRSALTMVARCKGTGTAGEDGRERALLQAYQSALRAAGAMDFE